MATEVKIVLSGDGKGLEVVLDGAKDQFAKLGNAAQDASKQATTGIDAIAARLNAMTASTVAHAVQIMAGLWSLDKILEYGKEMALMAARFETLGVAMTVVGGNAGYSGAQMEMAAQGMQKMGISMVESRQQAMRLVQAHIDLSESQKLARIAQDAAVIGNMNSSDAFAAMIHGISTGQPEVLRTIGLNVSMENSYKIMAATLGKHVDELSQNEKTQGILNAVMLAGVDIAGAYEAAMDTAGKQLNSMKRYTDDLKTVQGEVFNEVLTVAVMAYTNHLKEANGELKTMAANGEIKAWGMDLAEIFVWVANHIDNVLTGVKMLGNTLGTFVAQRNIKEKIAAEYQVKIDAAPQGFGPQGMLRSQLMDERDAKIKATMELLETDNNLIDRVGRIQRAWDERQKTLADKQQAVVDSTRARASSYAMAIEAWKNAFESGQMSKDAYIKAATGASAAMYGQGIPHYADTKSSAVHKGAVDEITKAAERGLKAFDDLTAKESGFNADFSKTVRDMVVARDKGKISVEQYAQAVALLLKNQPGAVAERKANQQGLDDMFKQIEANEKIRVSYINAKEAAEQYLATISRQAAGAAGGVGRGTAYRADQGGLNAIEDRLSGAQAGLARDERDRKIGMAEYAAHLALAQDTYAKEVALYQQAVADKRAAESDWLNGANEAAANYLSTTRNVAGSVEAMFTNAFKGAEDALTSFVTTGKLNFASLADSIISDLVRIAVRQNITGPLAKAMGGDFFGLFSASGNAFDGAGQVQKFAKGGTFSNQVVASPTLFKFANGTGMMGEAGPEAIMPLRRDASGRLGVQAAGGGGGNAVVVNIIESPGNGGQQSRRSENGVDILDVFVEKVKRSIAGDISRGSGAVPGALAGTYGLNRVAGAY